MAGRVPAVITRRGCTRKPAREGVNERVFFPQGWHGARREEHRDRWSVARKVNFVCPATDSTGRLIARRRLAPRPRRSREPTRCIAAPYSWTPALRNAWLIAPTDIRPA